MILSPTWGGVCSIQSPERTETANDDLTGLRLERADERTTAPENAARYRKKPVALEALRPRNAPADSRIRRATGMWREAPARVPASHGWWWFVQACDLFFARPGTWIKAMVGPTFVQRSAFLSLLVAGGIMVMAHRQSEGEASSAGDVFDGFRDNFGQLVMVAIYSGIGSLAVFGLAWMLSGGELRAFFGGGEWTRRALAALGFCFVGSLPLIASVFFAPTLVVLVGDEALDAMWKGFVACLVNWPAMLVNALVTAVVGGGVIALGVGLAFLLAPSSEKVAILLIWLAMICAGLRLFSVFSLMNYTAARDIFYDEG